MRCCAIGCGATRYRVVNRHRGASCETSFARIGVALVVIVDPKKDVGISDIGASLFDGMSASFQRSFQLWGDLSEKFVADFIGNETVMQAGGVDGLSNVVVII